MHSSGISARLLVFRLVLALAVLCCVPIAALAKAAPVGKLKVTATSLKYTAPGSQSFTVSNIGTAALQGTVGTPTNAAFGVTAGGGDFQLNPGAGFMVTVAFSGAPPKGKDTGKLPIAVGKTTKNVTLTGTGYASSGTVILFGGVPNTRDIEANDDTFSSTGLAFSAAPAMSDSRGFEHEAPYLDPAVVSGGAAGKVFVSGGQDDEDFILNSTELYDPTLNSLGPGPSLNVPRAEHTVTLFTTGALKGDVLIIGGLQLDDFGDRIALDDVELYDPATGSINDLGEIMKDARGQHTATQLNDGRILVTGGYDETFTGAFNNATATAELFDPGSKTFSCVGGGSSPCSNVMSSARWNHRATLLNDGTVLVTGGTPTDSGTREGTASADLFNPSNNSFSALPNMNSARQGHSSTLIQGCGCAADGMVLIAGGQNQTGAVTNTAELYDPSTKTFIKVGNMTSHRAEHQAVAFTTGGLAGYVLLMGGYPSPSETGTKTAELFNPNTRKFLAVGAMKVARYEFPATVVP
jgi:Galactose oxidase, central domain